MLIAAVMAQSFSKGVVLLNFYTHQAYISKYLCENKGKPMMKCCGKCQLRKKLAQEDKNSKDQQGNNRQGNDEVAAISSFCSYQKIDWKVVKAYHKFSYILPVSYSISIFHPPSA